MARIQLKSINLNVKELFGQDFLEIEGDSITLEGLLQKLNHNSSSELDLFHEWGTKVSEEYTILLNRQNLKIQTTALKTKLKIKDGDELHIIKMNILLGG